jgi:hypothetical protein
MRTAKADMKGHSMKYLDVPPSVRGLALLVITALALTSLFPRQGTSEARSVLPAQRPSSESTEISARAGEESVRDLDVPAMRGARANVLLLATSRLFDKVARIDRVDRTDIYEASEGQVTTGKAVLHSTMSLMPLRSETSAAVRIELTGDMNLRSRTRQPPVEVHLVGGSQIDGEMRVDVVVSEGDQQLGFSNQRVIAPVTLRPSSICLTRKALFPRLIRCIALRKTYKQIPEERRELSSRIASEITSTITGEIRTAFRQQMQPALADAREEMDLAWIGAATTPECLLTEWRFASRQQTDGLLQLKRYANVLNADMHVLIHESALAELLLVYFIKSDTRPKSQPLFDALTTLQLAANFQATDISQALAFAEEPSEFVVPYAGFSVDVRGTALTFRLPLAKQGLPCGTLEVPYVASFDQRRKLVLAKAGQPALIAAAGVDKTTAEELQTTYERVLERVSPRVEIDTDGFIGKADNTLRKLTGGPATAARLQPGVTPLGDEPWLALGLSWMGKEDLEADE